MCRFAQTKGEGMRSYIYENVKLGNGKSFVMRYTPVEGIVYNIINFLFYLFLIWPIQIFVWWPLKLCFKAALILAEMLLRSIWWIIRLPFCLLFSKRTPNF